MDQKKIKSQPDKESGAHVTSNPGPVRIKNRLIVVELDIKINSKFVANIYPFCVIFADF